MPAASIRRRRRRIAWRRSAVAAAVLGCAAGAAQGQPGLTPCTSRAERPWTCAGALASANLFEHLEATLSPDGTRYVYSRMEGGSRHLWLMDAATGAERRLTQGRGERNDPAWSPDGGMIVFTGEISGPLGRPASGIGVVDAATGEEWLAVAPPYSGSIEWAAWTPRGRILFEIQGPSPVSMPRLHADPNPEPRPFPRSDVGGLWTTDADGRDPVRLTRQTLGRTAAFSPSGDSLAWIGWECPDEEADGRGIWISGAEGGADRCLLTLPNHAARHGRLLWPHADTLLYSGPLTTDSTLRAYLVPAANPSPHRLDPVEDEVTGVSLARDGTLALSVHRPRARIALLPVAGGVPVPLPAEVPDGAWPEWTRSGAELTFTAVPRRAGWYWHDASLVQAPVGRADAGARPVRLTQPREEPSHHPIVRTTPLTGTWSPDGRHLATYTLVGISAEYRVARNDGVTVLIRYADTAHVGGPPVWSPDGTRLLLATGSQPYGSRTSPPPWSLVWVNIDSILRVPGGGYAGNFHPVPLQGFGGRAVWPRVSPDGEWIAFAAHPGLGGRGGVYVAPAGGGPVRALAEFAAGSMLTGPEWSARGDSVYFSSPDAAGVYQLRRVGRGGGAAETLTAGAEHVLHPRLSPDGRTLAVTLLDARTELWTRPGRFPAVAGPPPPPARGAAAPVSPAEIAAGLLELVRTAEARPQALRRLWPGFWDGRQAYAVRTGYEQTTTEALIVSPYGQAPAGFVPVDGPGLPAGLRGRLYHARGLAADVGTGTIGIPVVPVPTAVSRTPAERRERLRTLFAAAVDSVSSGRFSRAPFPGCPTHDPRSCGVQSRVENAILGRALDARGGELRELLRDYTALVWMWGGADPPSALWLQRVHGIPAYVAGRAADVAADTDPAGYRADVAARLAGPRPAPGRWTPAAHGIPGEAVALLLDRMDAGWRERVAAGAPLLEVLLSATGLSPAEALARAPDALRRGGFHAMLAELPPPAPPGADAAVSETFFLAALRTLAPGTPAIHLDLQTDRSPAGETGLEYRAGPAGAAVPAPGFVLLPDPAWVRVRAGNVDLEVRGHPVALITTPGIAWQSVRVIVYPRVDLTDVVPVRLPHEDDRPYHVRVEGIDLRIGTGAHVCPCAEIYIRPAP